MKTLTFAERSSFWLVVRIFVMLGNLRIRSAKLYSFFTRLCTDPYARRERGAGGGEGSVHKLIRYVCRRARSLRNIFYSGKTSGNSMFASVTITVCVFIRYAFLDTIPKQFSHITCSVYFRNLGCCHNNSDEIGKTIVISKILRYTLTKREFPYVFYHNPGVQFSILFFFHPST